MESSACESIASFIAVSPFQNILTLSHQKPLIKRDEGGDVVLRVSLSPPSIPPDNVSSMRSILYLYIFLCSLLFPSSLAFAPLAVDRSIRIRPTTTTTTREPPVVRLSALPAAADLVYSQDTYVVVRDSVQNAAILVAAVVGLIGLVVVILQSIVLPNFLAELAQEMQQRYPEFWQEQALPIIAAEGEISKDPEVFFTIFTKFLQVEEPEVWEKCVAGKLKPGESLGDRIDLYLAIHEELELIDKELDEMEESEKMKAKTKE